MEKFLFLVLLLMLISRLFHAGGSHTIILMLMLMLMLVLIAQVGTRLKNVSPFTPFLQGIVAEIVQWSCQNCTNHLTKFLCSNPKLPLIEKKYEVTFRRNKSKSSFHYIEREKLEKKKLIPINFHTSQRDPLEE